MPSSLVRRIRMYYSKESHAKAQREVEKRTRDKPIQLLSSFPLVFLCALAPLREALILLAFSDAGCGGNAARSGAPRRGHTGATAAPRRAGLTAAAPPRRGDKSLPRASPARSNT